MRTWLRFLICFALLLPAKAYSQPVDDLLAGLVDSNSTAKEPVEYSFKGTRLINMQTIEVADAGILEFRVAHRFGDFNSGLGNLYGLDGPASIKLALDYSPNGRLQFGIGRTNINRMIDGNVKYRLFLQNNGNSMPVSVTLFSQMNVTHVKDIPVPTPSGPYYKYDKFTNRMSYVNQVMIARKFNDRLTLQLAPTMVHYNLVDSSKQNNTNFALGISGRYMFTRRTGLTFEYGMRLNKFDPVIDNYHNHMGIGVDIETGGHVFQLFVVNSFGLNENQFLMRNDKSWTNGGTRFGFNISRVFLINQ